MIDAYPAAFIMLAFMAIFGVVLPIMDKSQTLGRFVSLRFAVLVVFLSMAVGVVLDFSHLENNIRLVIIAGTLIIGVRKGIDGPAFIAEAPQVLLIGGIFILIRTWEKAASKGWSIGIRKIEASKGDAKVTVDVEDKRG